MENLEPRISAIESKIDAIASQLTGGFELILVRLKELDNKILDLKGDSTGNLGMVEKTLDKGFSEIIEELKKINHVTGYEGISKNIPGQA